MNKREPITSFACLAAKVRGSVKIDLLIIIVLWCVSIIIIDPRGNFPLNDDWATGLTVKHLVETGEFRPVAWLDMSLIAQAAWGALFCIPFGFSFEALRVSTLTLSLLGILGSYYLVRELRPPKWLGCAVALTLALNPIYCASSNTFMTDVPFTAVIIFAAIFFVRNLRNDSTTSLLLGAAFAVAATLIRQLAVVVPMAFTIAFICRNGFTKQNIKRAAVPSILCIAALLVFQQWLKATGRLPAVYTPLIERLLFFMMYPGQVFRFTSNALTILLYIGWFLLPVLLLSAGSVWSGFKNTGAARRIFLITALILVSLYVFYFGSRLMPLVGNIVTTSGIGPFTLRDIYIMQIPHVPKISRGFWFLITAGGLFGSTWLVMATGVAATKLFPKLRPEKMDSNQAVTAFFLLSTALYMTPFIMGVFFDRYLLPITPFIAAGVVSLITQLPGCPSRRGIRLCYIGTAALLGVFFVFTVFSTRDYLTWNRTRWAALNTLMESKGVGPEEIDGGFEFNGMHLYDPKYKRTPGKSWWWVKGDTYLMTFTPVPGYSIIERYNYRQWMPPHTASLVLLKKNSREESSVNMTGISERSNDAKDE